MVVYAPGRTSQYPEIPPDRGLRYHYLGGGNEVGNVGIVLEDPSSNRLLLDYGIAPTKPPRYPNEAPHVSNAIITHSHIDHLGMVPWLASNHNTTLHGTELTAAISEMMWYDCHKVSSIEGYPLPWDKRDIDLALSAWKTHSFNKPWTQDDWKLELHGAGHIPGAAMLHVETPTKSVLFSGDFDTRDSQLTVGAKPVKTDVLFVEGTYGGRDHPPKQEENERFIERVIEVTDRGGTALVPAFANGRTQDVVMLLHKHLPELDVHVDGMGKRVAKLQMEHPETLRDPTALESAWRWCRRVSSKSDRKKALDADVIVSTSGMLDGGPSIWYLNRLRHDPKMLFYSQDIKLVIQVVVDFSKSVEFQSLVNYLQSISKLTNIPFQHMQAIKKSLNLQHNVKQKMSSSIIQTQRWHDLHLPMHLRQMGIVFTPQKMEFRVFWIDSISRRG